MQITSKDKCYGCSACATVCPNKAIELKNDNDGFLYPELDKSRCKKCGLCSKVCPAYSLEKCTGKEQHFYGLKAIRKKRLNSASGGAFNLVAEQILNKNGIIFGAGFDNELNLIQMQAKNKEELRLILQTKYIQVNPKDSFLKMINILKKDIWVSYVGTPCAIEGLKNIFKILKIEHLLKKCILVDFICSGVPSPGFWKAYLKYLNKNGKVIGFNFRDKSKPNNGHTVAIYRNNEITKENFLDNKWCRLYSKSIGLRNVCYNCKWCRSERVSDITIGDFWGIEKINSEFSDGYGTSLVISQNSKGEEVIKSFKFADSDIIEVSKEQATQPRLTMPTSKSLLNKFFYKDLIANGDATKCDVAYVLNKYSF